MRLIFVFDTCLWKMLVGVAVKSYVGARFRISKTLNIPLMNKLLDESCLDLWRGGCILPVAEASPNRVQYVNVIEPTSDAFHTQPPWTGLDGLSGPRGPRDTGSLC